VVKDPGHDRPAVLYFVYGGYPARYLLFVPLDELKLLVNPLQSFALLLRGRHVAVEPAHLPGILEVNGADEEKAEEERADEDIQLNARPFPSPRLSRYEVYLYHDQPSSLLPDR